MWGICNALIFTVWWFFMLFSLSFALLPKYGPHGRCLSNLGKTLIKMPPRDVWLWGIIFFCTIKDTTAHENLSLQRLHIELALRRENIWRFRVRLGLSFGYSVYLIISINMDANVAMCASARSFVRSLCVNALWISMDFSSEATIESISLSFFLSCFFCSE